MRPTTLFVVSSVCALVPVCGVRAQWSAPINMTSINTTGSDASCWATIDGLKLYYSSTTTASYELYYATRTAPYTAFGSPTHIAELTDPGADLSMTVRLDELEMFYCSTRTGGGGGSYDLWRTTRASPTAPWGTPTPVNELNTSSIELWPWLSLDGLRLYFTSNRPGGLGLYDILVASRPAWGQPFNAPTPVAGLNTSMDDNEAYFSVDELTVFFVSTRPGGQGARDIWMATRVARTLPFGTAVVQTALNTTTSDESPAFAMFHDELYLTSSRPGGVGSFDFWVARYTGLVGVGVAGPSSTADLRFSDPPSSGRIYVAASSLGSSPGIRIDTRVLPLNFDLLFQLSIGGVPPILTGYVGALNQDGIGAGRISFAGFGQFVGLRFFTAFAVLNPTAPSGIVTISNAHEVLVQ